MRIDSLELEDFRNYARQRVELDPDCNVIFGENAQGKTNLLEAVVYLSRGKSPRARTDREMIRFDAPAARMEAEVFSREREFRVRVELYRVGEVDAYGRYKSLAGFESLDLESVGSQTTAEEWEEKAGKAAMLVKEAEKGEALLSPEHYVLEVKEGKGVLRELPSGMYLMAPREAVTLEYCYAFLPSLLALPGYGLSAEPEGQGETVWAYEVRAGLKPERRPRYLELEIEKILTGYGEGMGPAVFVFQVEAEKEEKGEMKTVYSNTVTAVFAGEGSQVFPAGRIPAGAQVTVTEVYSGGSYVPEGPKEQTFPAEIKEDSLFGERPEEEQVPRIRVTFRNRYDGGLIPGTGIRNRFTRKEGETGWNWEAVSCGPGGEEETGDEREE